MKLYFINISASLTNLYLHLILWGLSAGFVNYVPVVAIIGCILLFVIIPPLLVLRPRLGYLGGLLCALSILPWAFGFLISSVHEIYSVHEFQFTLINILLFMPCLLLLVSGYLSAYFFVKKKDIALPTDTWLRFSLATIPALLFILYIITTPKIF